MKLTILLALLSLNTFAVDFTDIAGTYQVSTEYAPIVNIVTIEANATVSLTETSPYGEYQCTGTATITNSVLESNLICDGNQKYTQRVNLAGISNFQLFTASVYSSLFDSEMPMDFTKISK